MNTRRLGGHGLFAEYRFMAVLSLLMAFASISTDLYLPAMPAMARELHIAPGLAAMTVSMYLVGFSLGQLMWGPLSDRFGRRAPLMVGLVVFAMGSAGCALAGSAVTIVGWRAVQAIGACASVVIARAMVRDRFEGTRGAQVMSTLMTIMALAPLLGPVIGSAVLGWGGSWRLIFAILVVTGLGGYDQWWSLVLPSAVSVFNILVLRSFYSSTSTDLIDAARMDGAGEWRTLWSIVLPTSRAVTAVIALFYAVGYWNSFFNVMLYMPTDSPKWPLQYVLYIYVNRGNGMPGSVNAGFGTTHAQTAPLSLQMAVVVLTLVPLLIVYPFVQKHFRTGVLTGAIKG